MPDPLTFASAVVYTSDVPGALEFYRRATGLEPVHHDPSLGFAVLGADGRLAIASHAAGALMLGDGYAAVRADRVRGAELAFWAADVAAAFETAVAAGAAPLTSPRRMPWGQTVAYVQAPDGTIIGFVTRPEAETAEP